ncbi:MAG: Crp/Fnr family transcriptional regulator [Bacteroidetes bacterium]|nr:Crp/Fnr family transcriptional regulator [Bacteroidota bacterium]
MHVDPNTIPIFQGISQEEMDQIIKYAFIKTFDTGYVLFRENLIVGQIMYVVLSGSVEITKKDNTGKESTIAVLGPGACIGEMSLFEQEKRSASALIKDRAELLVMPKYNFDRMLQSRPNETIKILLNFIKVMSQRLRDTTQKLVAHQAEGGIPDAPAGAASPASTGQMSVQDVKARAAQAPAGEQRIQLEANIAGGTFPTKDGRSSEVFILTLEELQNENLMKILEQKRVTGMSQENGTRLLMIRDLLNYYLQIPVEELQLKVREMELRFRSRGKK